MGTVKVRLCGALCLALLVSAANADDGSGTLSIQVENDRISNTDRHYTHGTRVTWVSDKADSDAGWPWRLVDRVYPLADMRKGRYGLSLGHNIYTPEDTEKRGVVARDRPYAGWLYLAPSLHVETSSEPLETLDSVELSLGVIGPAAMGEQVQNQVHKLIGVATAKGWRNQLDNEPAINLFAERKWRTSPAGLLGFEVDLLPHLGGGLGTVMTLANAGVTLRLGYNLDVDFGPPHIRPSLAGIGNLEPDRDFAYYFFIGADGRLVGRNVFLDGNSFSSSHSVRKRPFVGDLQTGVVGVFKGFRVSFTTLFRSKEFYGQRTGDIFGALSLSMRL